MVQKSQREYTIGPGDLLVVDVFDIKELSGQFRVSQAGTLALPLVPVRMQVSGLTELQVEKKIEEILEANGLVSHPQVSVVTKEKKSKPIMVVGAVMHPMVYHAERPVTLLEVLSEAGGVSNEAGGTVIVTRGSQQALSASAAAQAFPEWKEASGSPATSAAASDAARGADGNLPPPAAAPASAPPAAANEPPRNGEPAGKGTGSATTPPPASVPENAPDPPSHTITLNLDDLLEKADLQGNLLLEGGDIVSVPRGGIVYILGAVSRTGAFVMASDHSQMSILKLLSLAGGLQRSAKASAAVILRKDEKGQQQQVRVDLGRILARKSEDVPLNPNDILVVPESGGKRTAMRLAEIAIGVGSAAAVFRIAR